MVLALQGGMAVGKTTAARYVAAHAPDVTVFFEDNAPALAALQGRGLDKHVFEDYCEIQRAFIRQEIDHYARASACPCALLDLGPQEIEFYTLHYPRSIGQDWPVEQALAPELAALRRTLTPVVEKICTLWLRMTQEETAVAVLAWVQRCRKEKI